MACDRCYESKANGDKFCPYCGSDFKDLEEDGSMPVPQNVREPLSEKYKQIFFGIGLAISVLIAAVIIFELFVAITGIGTVLDGLDANPDTKYSLFIITPYIVELFSLSGVSLKVYYFILILVVIICVALAFFFSAKQYRDIGKDSGESAKLTPIYEIAVLFAMMFLTEMIYIMLVGAKDSPIDDTPMWKKMFSLLSASVWEEVVSRFLIIGVPIAIIYLAKNRDSHELKKALGGFDNFDLLTMILIFLSAGVFALAHVTSGSWAEWKIIPTLLFGLIAGYVFVKYGLYAAIVLHFLNDYIQAESWFSGVSYEPFTMFVLVVVSVISIPLLYVYGKRIIEFIKTGFDDF